MLVYLCARVSLHVYKRVCVCASAIVCSRPSFKCGNMLSLAIRGSGSENKTLLKYPKLEKFSNPTLVGNVTL